MLDDYNTIVNGLDDIASFILAPTDKSSEVEARLLYDGEPKLSPEKALLARVLRDALDAVNDQRPSVNARERRRQAIEWFKATDFDWPFAFGYICAAFKFDVKAVRKRVLRFLHDSSAVERAPVKRGVAGSSPARAANEKKERIEDADAEMYSQWQPYSSQDESCFFGPLFPDADVAQW